MKRKNNVQSNLFQRKRPLRSASHYYRGKSPEELKDNPLLKEFSIWRQTVSLKREEKEGFFGTSRIIRPIQIQ